MFSDEKKFNLDGPDGFHSYWRDLRKEKRIFSKRNFGGGSLMVWGAFCADGLLRLSFPSCRMNSVEYQKVLESSLIPFLCQKKKKYVFQQDNAAIHVSSSTKEWFKEQKLEVLEWPARSPDLNPIENLWGCLAREVYKDCKQFATVSELETAVIDAWDHIRPELICSLVSSMENRLFELVRSNGGYTKY